MYFNKLSIIIVILSITNVSGIITIIGSPTDYYMQTSGGTPIVVRDGITGYRVSGGERKASGTVDTMALKSLSRLNDLQMVPEINHLVNHAFIVYAYAGMATLSSNSNATNDPTFITMLKDLVETNTVHDSTNVNFENNHWKLMTSAGEFDEIDDDSSVRARVCISYSLMALLFTIAVF